ncbi:hypothetical protein ACLKA7_001960 [Drosophila subpalustris]
MCKKSLANQVQQQQEKYNKQDQKMDVQETIEEKDCVRLTENDTDNGGHQGVSETKKTVAEVERKNKKQTKEKRKQIGTNEKRMLVAQKKELNTKPEKQFPTDCPGPLESPHCSSTCFKKTITGSPTACEKTSTSTI